jgi:putative transposase
VYDNQKSLLRTKTTTNELSQRSIRKRGRFLSGYDVQNYTKGAGKALGLNSATLQMIGHEYATRRKQFKKLVNENAAIFVGNVSSLKLVKTKMAKSVLDAGWGTLKTLLEYKCDHAGVVFQEINEAYSTQCCSSCQVIADSSPKGRAGLGIREWTCSECGAEHDRDINAAKNILALGHERLAGGIPH